MDLEPFPNNWGPLEEIKEDYKKRSRVVTDEDIAKYEPMIEKYIRDFIVKNWSNDLSGYSHKMSGDVFLGNTGVCLNDIRQDLRAEVCIALRNYNPDFRTKEGRSVKESTFMFRHLFNRVGSKMKRLTKKRYGYGIFHDNLEKTFWENSEDQ